MTAEIITIGDELLIGQVINTNQAYIAERLNGIGIRIGRMTSVGDDVTDILAAFEAAWKRNDVVIVTGGLGPTHDDITKKAVCTFFHTDVVPNEEIRKHLLQLLERWNRPWGPTYDEQVLFPRKAKLIPNPIGSAGGMLFEEEKKYFIVLPGVPFEMKEMVDQSVVPLLAGKVSNSVIRQLTLRTTGISESMLTAQLGDIGELLQGSKLAFLPSPTGVRLRITVHGSDAGAVEQQLGQTEQRIRTRIERHIYAAGDTELEEVVGSMLTVRGLTIAVAESCTGGLLADKFTDVSGSSNYFQQGLVTYSNTSKVEVLGVPSLLIEQHGAVSKEVAEAMAAGIRRVARTDIGMSTTGIAGPTGATSVKPLGLVWVGYADAETTLAVRFHFGDNRRRVKERAAQAALELLQRRLLRIE